jgi:hypothetical protein
VALAPCDGSVLQVLEEKVEQFMESGESPFAAHMEGGDLYLRAQNTLSDVMEKHEDIKRLERSISELADMFNGTHPTLLPPCSVHALLCFYIRRRRRRRFVPVPSRSTLIKPHY